MNHAQKNARIRKIIPRFLSIVLQVTVGLALVATSVFAAVPTIFKVIIQKSDGTGNDKVAVQFTEAVYGNIAHTLGLAPSNLVFSGSSPVSATAVDHALGSDTAILTLDVGNVPYVSGVSGVVLIDGASIYSADAQFVSGNAFDLVSAVTDAVPPIMSSVFAVDNVNQPNIVTVFFDEALGDKTGAENPANWTLTNSGVSITYSISSVALSADRKKVTLTLPTIDKATPATYITNTAAASHLQVTPSANIVDLVGNPWGGGLVSGLNEMLILDNTPPTANAILSKVDATHFTLRFSEKMAADAGNYLQYTVSGSGGATNGGLAVLQANGTDVNILVSDTSGFTSGQTLTIAPSTAVKDFAGNSASGVATYTANALTYSTNTFTEAGGNFGSSGNSIIVTLTGDTFSGVVGEDFTQNGKASVTNLPAGLWAYIYPMSSNQVAVNLWGNAISHGNADSVNNLTINFANSAFTGNNASAIANSAVSNLAINFYDSDNTPPAVTLLKPFNNENHIYPTSNFFINFSESVLATAANISIRKTSDNALVESFPANDASRVSVFGSNVVITPSGTLDISTGYYLTIASGAFTDTNSPVNSFPGLVKGEWGLVTGAVSDTTPPTLGSFSPSLGSTDIANSTNLELEFSEPISVGSGNITIYDSTAVTSFAIDVTDITKVKLWPTLSGTSYLSINPGNTLVNGHAYYVNIDSGAFKDRANLNNAGISNNSTWAFTVAAADVTPPKVLNIIWTAVTSNSAIFSATIDESGTGYYAVLPANDPAPTTAQVVAGSVGVAKGSVPSMVDDVAQTFTVNGLSAGTPHKLYFAAKDAALNVNSWFGWGNVYFITAVGTPPPIYTDTYVPPPPPPPPISTPSGPTAPVTTPGQVINNPPPNVTVDPTGAIVITAPTEPTAAPIVISPTATENALVKLPTNRPITITADKTTLTYTDKQGGSQLVVRTVDGQPQLEIANGIVAITSTTPGNVIPVISVDLKSVGTVTTSSNSDSVVVVKNDKSAVVFVDTGKVDYKGPNQDAKGVSVYSGENAKLNNASGQLDQITLGSHNGENQVPGDPLPQQPGYAADTHVPKLDGNLPRFNNTLSLLDILHDAIEQVLGDASGQISYDKSTGVVSYIIGDHGYRLIPLGEIQVLLNQLSAASVTATASGAFNLASQGIQMSLSGAVGYFSDLNQVVKALDAGGAITLKPSGTLDMSLGGKRYAGIPGLAASLPATPTPIPGFEVDGGFAVFRDHLGVLQTLYPAALDMDSVTAALKGVDPAANLTNNGNGTLTAKISGQTFTFLPEYQVTAAPGSHASEAWWAEGNVIYIRNSDNSAQGFRL